MHPNTSPQQTPARLPRPAPLSKPLRRTLRVAGSWASSALLVTVVSGLTLACSGEGAGPTDAVPPATTGDVPGAVPSSSTPVTPGTPGSVTPGVPTPTTTTPGVVTPGNPVTPVTPVPTTPIDVTNADCSVPKAPATLMRRLTTFEYNNVVFDLLGVKPTTQIPLDGVTDGYDNNTSVLNVSSLHAEKFVLASEEVAKAAVQNIATLAPCSATDEAGELECARTFAQTFGRLAFRRTVTADDESALLTAYGFGRDGGSYAEGIEVMLRAILQSPYFLYRVERAAAQPIAGSSVAAVDSFEMATRLAFLVWGSTPDAALLDAAAGGELTTKESIATWARTMLADDKAKRGIVNFYEQWLGLSKLGITQKNSTFFPAYTDAAQTALAGELPAFMTHLLWEGDHKLTSMLTSPVAFVNKDTAVFYGLNNVTSDAAMQVELPADQERAGVLTQASFLAVQAHPDQTSPVLRGKFVRTKLMCTPPPPPPADADITPPDVASAKTARERLSGHLTAGSSCASCHALMDPIGFAFEHYDAVGQFRLQENGVDIDVSGEITGGTESLAGAFSGVHELGTKLAASAQVQTCVATQWFRFAAGRNEAAGDECSLSTLQSQFATSQGDLVELVVAMTQTDAFLYRPTEVTQ